MRGRKSRIDWDNIKITIVRVEDEKANSLNPCYRMTPFQRREKIVDISARIWSRHCREKREKETASSPS